MYMRTYVQPFPNTSYYVCYSGPSSVVDYYTTGQI